jgi:hypothetical protein
MKKVNFILFIEHVVLNISNIGGGVGGIVYCIYAAIIK